MSEPKNHVSKHHTQRLRLMFALSIGGIPLFALFILMIEPHGLEKVFAGVGVFVFGVLAGWSRRSLR